MFEKLLSVLPYNPGLVHQMSFYGRRMREEAIIRRTGLIFLALTFMVQFFAVLSPPQVTSANDNNDLISGGVSSAADAKAKCDNDVRNYKEIMANYNIACDDIGNAGSLTIHSKGQDYYSMGWTPYHRAGSNETTVNVPGAGTLYFRKLSSFDTGSNAASKAGSAYPGTLRVTNSAGNVYYILAGCGNLVSVGIPVPFVPPKPKPLVTPPKTVVATPGPTTPAAPVTPVTPATPVTPTTPVTPVTPTCKYNPAIAADSLQCYKPCKYNSLLQSDDINCKPCDKSLSSQDTLSCVTVHKKASNVTAGISDANGTTAQPGDVITYTLSATNGGQATVKAFTFQESLSDVLDYADVVNLYGGNIDNYGTVTWPVDQVGPNATVAHQITVKVKNPIPSTPVDPSNPNHFDLTMTNVYGDTVNIKVPAPPAKAIQTTAAALPNTGPGTGLFLAAAVVMVAGYFYARARLLARESELAIKETAYV